MFTINDDLDLYFKWWGNEITLLSVLGNNNVIWYSGKCCDLLMISISTRVVMSVNFWVFGAINCETLGSFWFSGWTKHRSHLLIEIACCIILVLV